MDISRTIQSQLLNVASCPFCRVFHEIRLGKKPSKDVIEDDAKSILLRQHAPSSGAVSETVGGGNFFVFELYSTGNPMGAIVIVCAPVAWVSTSKAKPSRCSSQIRQFFFSFSFAV